MRGNRYKVTTRKDPNGVERTARQAVQYGLDNDRTAKETAFETGWSLNAIQTTASRMRVSFVYSGVGKRPRLPHPTKQAGEQKSA